VKDIRPANNTYGQILKSAALIGGSSMMRVGLGMVRNKAMALLLGPAGVGMLGLYSSIADIAQSLAGMGINTSGVRQIAEATSSGDNLRVARTVTTLRLVALALGILGALLLAAFCRPIGRLSFGDELHAKPVALLALAVLFGAVSSGQLALVQGMRRIRDLAMTNVLGAVYGTVFGIVIIYFLKEQGIVPSLVCVAAMGIVTSWWYARKIQVQRVAMKLADFSAEVSALLKLGFVFMSVGLMSMGMAYLVRIIVVRKIGVDAAGFYQSAWTLGGLYVGFILQAMGADFFPRLSAASRDNHECNRLVNEQAEISLLLAGPGIIGSLTFAPVVIHVFYSASFTPAVELLRWICLGMMLRVASWPMGFILLAKGARYPYFWTEFASTVANVGLLWIAVSSYALNGAGIAFFAGYVFYGVLVYFVVRAVSGFRWSTTNKRIGLIYGGLITAVFVGWYLLPGWAMMTAGAVATALAGVFSIRRLCTLLPLARLPKVVQRGIIFFRLVSPTESS